VLRVIDVPSARDGLVLKVLMNGELDLAVGFLDEAGSEAPEAPTLPTTLVVREGPPPVVRPAPADDHWGWRMAMAERIAGQLDPERFGVEAMFVYGSTKNATAGTDSDLDLLIQFSGSPGQRRELLAWLEGWGRALSEANFLRTGRRVPQLLDIVLVSAEDVAERRGVAGKVRAVTDTARELRLLGR
jgi:hypothetical protein